METHWWIVPKTTDRETGEVSVGDEKSKRSVPPGLGRKLIARGHWQKLGEHEVEGRIAGRPAKPNHNVVEVDAPVKSKRKRQGRPRIENKAKEA